MMRETGLLAAGDLHISPILPDVHRVEGTCSNVVGGRT